MDAGMEQSCNFLLYMIIMERQDTTYTEFRVELLHKYEYNEDDDFT